MTVTKRTITFEDTDAGANLFVMMFSAYHASPIRWSNPELLRRGIHILDQRDAISVPVNGNESARELKRGLGEQQIRLARSEFDLFSSAVKLYEWPPSLARQAIDVLDMLDNAGDAKEPAKG